jgi:hypothetical protein
MSVSKEQADSIAKYAENLWASFSEVEKMERTHTPTVKDADERFRKFNAADKHICTLP